MRLNLGGIGRSSVTLTYEIVNATTGARLAEGRTVSVTLDPATQRQIPVPGRGSCSSAENRWTRRKQPECDSIVKEFTSFHHD